VPQPHPSAQRLNDLLEFVKAEFEQVAVEGGVLRAQREEYEAMSESLHSSLSVVRRARRRRCDNERKQADKQAVDISEFACMNDTGLS